MDVSIELGRARRIGTFLRARHLDVLRAWEEEIRRLPSGYAVSDMALRSGLPELVHALVTLLEQPGPSSDRVFEELVRERAVQRFRLGMDLRQVVDEYRVLRATLLRRLTPDRTRDVGELLAGIARVDDAIDRAITVAVERHASAHEHALQESQQMLHAIVHNAPAVIVLKDCAGRILLVNRAYERAFGVTAAQMQGRSDENLLPHDVAKRLASQDAEVQHTGLPSIIEEKIPSSSGPMRCWLIGKYPLHSADGSITGICGIATDITERKAVEEARELFLGMLGHDLRNPLAAVSAWLDTVRRAGVTTAQQNAIDRCRHNLARMDRMIRDLLDFTRVRLGEGIPVKPRPTDLAEVCRRAVEEALLSAPGRHISIEVHGDASGNFDADRAEQAVGNLVGNALRYGTDPIEVVVTGRADHVSIDVKNRGPAIPQELLGTLFDPFKRCASSDACGLGLGLYIVQGILRAHGGRVRARSDDGCTVFSTRWPRQAPAPS